MREIQVHSCVCGGIPEIESLLNENKWFYISCTKCNRKTDKYCSIRQTARKWNKWMKQLNSIKYIHESEVE